MFNDDFQDALEFLHNPEKALGPDTHLIHLFYDPSAFAIVKVIAEDVLTTPMRPLPFDVAIFFPHFTVVNFIRSQRLRKV